jgi:hypothetical protein
MRKFDDNYKFSDVSDKLYAPAALTQEKEPPIPIG